LIANHPEFVKTEFALNEGGRTRLVQGKPLYVAVQNTEKVAYNVLVTAHGPGGHAAIPLEGNAITRLGRALAAIGAHQEPVVMKPTTKVFFADLGAVWPDKRVGKAMLDVSSGNATRVAAGAKVLSTIPVFNAVIRNGISPTLISGGIRSNVIPTEATATLNVRNLPGESIHALVKRLKTAVNDSMVSITVADSGVDTPASSFKTPMFTAIADAVKELDPSMVTVPYLSTGATDSARLRALGMQAYGILPFPMAQDDEDRMHGNDERIPLTSLEFGTKLIYGAMVRVTK
jgi:acetylornithine deacetylase/succinyl-diaminopimelate desuccinylase-like protein